jgi:hypothetical protein
MLRVVRAMSGRVATLVYVLLSITAVGLHLYSLNKFALAVFKPLGALPPSLQDQFLQTTFISLTLLPNTILFTSTVRQFTKLLYGSDDWSDSFNLGVVLLFVAYLAVWLWVSQNPFRIMYLFVMSSSLINAGYPLFFLGFVVYGFAFGMMSMWLLGSDVAAGDYHSPCDALRYLLCRDFPRDKVARSEFSQHAL